jgi:hypothetical protein
MRYFCYMQTGGERGETYEVVTLSEEEIREEYYADWFAMMRRKYTIEQMEQGFCFEDFLDDWIVVNRAWESK